MIFSSWRFIFVFLPIAIAGCFAIPVQAQVVRKWWLFAPSLFFHGRWKVDPADDFFDTTYHLMHPVAIERTRRLLVRLAPHLKLQPVGTC